LGNLTYEEIGAALDISAATAYDNTNERSPSFEIF